MPSKFCIVNRIILFVWWLALCFMGCFVGKCRPFCDVATWLAIWLSFLLRFFVGPPGGSAGEQVFAVPVPRVLCACAAHCTPQTHGLPVPTPTRQTWGWASMLEKVEKVEKECRPGSRERDSQRQRKRKDCWHVPSLLPDLRKARNLPAHVTFIFKVALHTFQQLRQFKYLVLLLAAGMLSWINKEGVVMKGEEIDSVFPGYSLPKWRLEKKETF